MSNFFIISCISFVGFLLSYIIYHERHTSKHKTNIFRIGSCERVFHSRFARFLGFEISVIGMTYFGIMGLLLLVLPLVFPGMIVSIPVTAIIVACSLVAAVFATYFLGLQITTLRLSCTWCNIIWIIAILLAYMIPQAFVLPLSIVFSHVKPVIVILHAIAAAVGLGSVIVTDVMFHRFLRDRVITKEEVRSMDILSEVVWAGLIALIITGIYLVVADPTVFTKSKFLIKLLIVGVITINGILLHMIIRPKLVQISFNQLDKDFHDTDELRHLAFAFGAVSFVSWIIVFILGSLRNIPVSFGVAFAIYLLVVAGAVLGSQIFERSITRK